MGISTAEQLRAIDQRLNAGIAGTTDFEAAATTLSSTPTPVPGSGAFTSVSATLKCTKIADRVLYNGTVTITTNGTAATYIALPLPYTPLETTAGSGIDFTAKTGLAVFASSASAAISITKYDGTYPGASGKTLHFSGHFRVA